MNEFLVTFKNYPNAIRLLFSRHFRWYLFVPIVLILLSFMGGNLVVSTLSDQLTERVKEYMAHLDFETPMLEKISMLFIRIAVRLTYLYLFLSLGGYIILITMSPILSLLADKADSEISGEKMKYGFMAFLHDVLRAIILAIRNFILQMVLTLILFFLSFVPMMGLITPILMFIVTAYFYGFSFVDYIVERQKRSLKDGIYYINKHLGVVFAIGIPFTLALAIPVIKVFVCGYLAMLSIIVATLVLTQKSVGNRN